MSIKKFERAATSILKEHGNWSFWVLWGESEGIMGQSTM